MAPKVSVWRYLSGTLGETAVQDELLLSDAFTEISISSICKFAQLSLGQPRDNGLFWNRLLSCGSAEVHDVKPLMNKGLAMGLLRCTRCKGEIAVFVVLFIARRANHFYSEHQLDGVGWRRIEGRSVQMSGARHAL